MKHTDLFVAAFLLCTFSAMAGERIEPVPFGDMDQWVTRIMQESKLLGGHTKTIYAVGPTDTIRGNVPYSYGSKGNPWTTSNVYAKVAGVEKISGSTRPERRGNGYCARMDALLDSVVAMRIINLKALVTGTLFTGRTIEPVGMAATTDPYAVLDMGIPFTGHPTALMVDYKAIVENSDTITYAKAVAKPRYKQGCDYAEIYIYLQHRWEDQDGKIHARRVGTGYLRIKESVPEWQNDHRIPIRWGDITMQPGFKSYEGLNHHNFKAMNSKGKMRDIQEEGYGLEKPTHMIIMLTSGCYEAFVGHEGNTLWVDNVRLVYDE